MLWGSSISSVREVLQFDDTSTLVDRFGFTSVSTILVLGFGSISNLAVLYRIISSRCNVRRKGSRDSASTQFGFCFVCQAKIIWDYCNQELTKRCEGETRDKSKTQIYIIYIWYVSVGTSSHAAADLCTGSAVWRAAELSLAQLDFTLLSLQLACPGLPASRPHCKASGGPCLTLDCDTGVRAEEWVLFGNVDEANSAHLTVTSFLQSTESEFEQTSSNPCGRARAWFIK